MVRCRNLPAASVVAWTCRGSRSSLASMHRRRPQMQPCSPSRWRIAPRHHAISSTRPRARDMRRGATATRTHGGMSRQACRWPQRLATAARPAAAAAERYAALFGAELRALSVVEPLAVIPEVPQQDTTDYYRRWEEALARDVWPLIRASGVGTVVRHGTALETILREAADWRADLVVVASHGKGPVKRMLVGSVTEGLINHLPTSLLVVPGGGAPVGHDARELMPHVNQREPPW